MPHPERTFVIAGDIDHEVVVKLTKFLLYNEEAGEDVCIQITSDGGDATAGTALFDLIRGLSIKVTTEAYGDVMSAAFLVFQAGHWRRIAPYARLMWHDAWQSVRGKFESKELDRKVRDLIQIDRLGNLALAERLEIPVETAEAWSQATTYWTASEAITAGLADELTRSVNT